MYDVSVTDWLRLVGDAFFVGACHIACHIEKLG